MNGHLHLFETEAEFTSAYTNDYTEPWVSYCIETSGLSYNKGQTPPAPSHDYVEIGSIKWATMNLGATAVTDYGKYYAWGETTGYEASQVPDDKRFELGDYKWYDSTDGFIKYNSQDGLTVLQSIDNPIITEWGGNWRMPATEEWQTLYAAVNTAWTSDYQGSGIAGVVCTDKNDSSKALFFPSGGVCYGGMVRNVGASGCYWSNSRHAKNAAYASCMGFFPGAASWDNSSRYYGLLVRGVLDE